MATKTAAAAAIVLILILLCITTTPSLAAKVYQVGDEAGWTSNITTGNHHHDYWGWARTKTFYVGDVLLFQYDNRSDSLLQVNQGAQILCNTSNPIATYNTGSDAVRLDAPGHYFFISGVSDHCWDANQKLQVFVNPIIPPSMSPAPTHSTSVSTPALPTHSTSVSRPAPPSTYYPYNPLDDIAWFILIIIAAPVLVFWICSNVG